MLASTSTVTTCSDRWQVFSTAEHKQKLCHFYTALLHAWSKSHSKAILLNDKWELARRFQYRYSNFSLSLLISLLQKSLLISLLQKSLNHPYIFFFFLPRNSSHASCVTAALFKTRPCFCDRSVLQIGSQFALLSYSSSDRLTILLPRYFRNHLSVLLLPQHCWIHLVNKSN